MSAHHYHTCRRCIGRHVAITTHDGAVHQGIIHSVNRTHVYLRSAGNRSLGGFAYGFGGYGGYGGFGGYGGYGRGIGLGSIAALAILPFLFW